MDYLKYWTPVGVLAAAFAGMIAGGNWVWVGIISFPVLAVLDSVLPRDYSQRKMSNATLANIPIWLCATLPLALFGVMAASRREGSLSKP